MMVESMPERINVMKVVTYDVQQIINDLAESGEDGDTITIDDVMRIVEDYARDDFSCGWGHQEPVNNLIFQTSDGEDL